MVHISWEDNRNLMISRDRDYPSRASLYPNLDRSPGQIHISHQTRLFQMACYITSFCSLCAPRSAFPKHLSSAYPENRKRSGAEHLHRNKWGMLALLPAPASQRAHSIHVHRYCSEISVVIAQNYHPRSELPCR